MLNANVIKKLDPIAVSKQFRQEAFQSHMNESIEITCHWLKKGAS